MTHSGYSGHRDTTRSVLKPSLDNFEMDECGVFSATPVQENQGNPKPETGLKWDAGI